MLSKAIHFRTKTAEDHPGRRRGLAPKMTAPNAGRLAALGCFLLAGIVALSMALALAAEPAQAENKPADMLGQSARQTAGDGQKLFTEKCRGCHTVGAGKLIGPDLQDVTKRRDAAWLQSFIQDPGTLFASNDPTAAQLLAEYKMMMPALGLSAVEVDSIIKYLADPSAVPAAVVENALKGSAAAGRQLFNGGLPLANGGPACIACHSAAAAGVLGGGTLGPDLTNVAARLGEPGLSASLQNIAFPTMASFFTAQPLTPQETADLVAYLKQVNAQVPAAQPAANMLNTYTILGIGLAGCAVLFLVLLVFWPGQRQSISSRLRAQK
jgi:cytochrome c2